MPFCAVFCLIISTLIFFYFNLMTPDGSQREVYWDFQPIFKYQFFKLFFQLTHNTQILPVPQVMSKICSCLNEVCCFLTGNKVLLRLQYLNIHYQRCKPWPWNINFLARKTFIRVAVCSLLVSNRFKNAPRAANFIYSVPLRMDWHQSGLGFLNI